MISYVFKIKKLCEVRGEDLFNETVNDHAIY